MTATNRRRRWLPETTQKRRTQHDRKEYLTETLRRHQAALKHLSMPDGR